MLDGKMTMALTERNADPAHGLSIKEARDFFSPHSGSPRDLLCKSIIVGF